MSSPAPSSPALIDPRGPRFGAWVTSAVLTVVLLVSGSHVAAGLLLTAQGVVFGLGSRGKSPYVVAWKRFLRTGVPAELEAAAPPRFAQTVGLSFAVVGAVGFLTGVTLVGQVATGFALVTPTTWADEPVFRFCFVNPRTTVNDIEQILEALLD